MLLNLKFVQNFTLPSCRMLADQNFITSQLSNFIDALELLFSINFRVPFYFIRNPTSFSVPTNTTSYGHDTTIHITGCFTSLIFYTKLLIKLISSLSRFFDSQYYFKCYILFIVIFSDTYYLLFTNLLSYV